MKARNLQFENNFDFIHLLKTLTLFIYIESHNEKKNLFFLLVVFRHTLNIDIIYFTNIDSTNHFGLFIKLHAEATVANRITIHCTRKL